MTKKTVRFDYFETMIRKYDKEANTSSVEKLDLSSLFDKIEKMNKKDTTKPFRGEKARVQKINFRKDELYEIQFLRLRESMPPGIANDEGDFEIIKLEESEYIGEFTAALYDPTNSRLVMHRNFQAFTPSGIEEYLNSTLGKSDMDIELIPIFDVSDIESILNSKIYRSLSISLPSDLIDKFGDNSSLNQVLKQIDVFDGATLKIDISVGRARKDKSLNPREVRETIKDILGVKDLNKLIVKHKENEDTKVETVDLLDQRLHDIYEFNIERSSPLTYDAVISKLVELYKSRK